MSELPEKYFDNEVVCCAGCKRWFKPDRLNKMADERWLCAYCYEKERYKEE